MRMTTRRNDLAHRVGPPLSNLLLIRQAVVQRPWSCRELLLSSRLKLVMRTLKCSSACSARRMAMMTIEGYLSLQLLECLAGS